MERHPSELIVKLKPKAELWSGAAILCGALRGVRPAIRFEMVLRDMLPHSMSHPCAIEVLPLVGRAAPSPLEPSGSPELRRPLGAKGLDAFAEIVGLS